MVPIVIVLICIGWRILQRRQAEEKDENEFLAITTRPIDPDESMKINSDDESIPYKKDIVDDSPETPEPIKVVENEAPGYGVPYGQTYDQAQPQSRKWEGETEIN